MKFASTQETLVEGFHYNAFNMRLPDIYFTRNPLEGHPHVEGQGEPVAFKQGEDIIFDQYLTFEGQPVLVQDWDIEVVVKKSVFANTRLWVGTLNNGLYLKNNTGFYQIIIPSEATSLFLAGTYWMDIFIHEKIGRGEIKDRDVVVATYPFSIEYSAASPNPKDLDRGHTEQTQPQSWDIRT